MADLAINKTNFNELTSFSIGDLLLIEDVSEGETKVIESAKLLTGLYNNGIKTLETKGSAGQELAMLSATSFFYFGGYGTGGLLAQSADDTILQNLTAGRYISLRAKNTGGTLQTVFKGSGDGAVELYYAGSKKLESIASGVKISNIGATATLTLAKIDATDDFVATHNILFQEATKTNFVYMNNVFYSGHPIFSIQAYNGSAYPVLLKMIEGGAVELYNAGTKAAETTSDGGTIGIATMGALYIGAAGTNGSWRFVQNGDNLQLEQREAGSWVMKYQFDGS